MCPVGLEAINEYLVEQSMFYIAWCVITEDNQRCISDASRHPNRKISMSDFLFTSKDGLSVVVVVVSSKCGLFSDITHVVIANNDWSGSNV